jgi:hypothetical protein
VLAEVDLAHAAGTEAAQQAILAELAGLGRLVLELVDLVGAEQGDRSDVKA